MIVRLLLIVIWPSDERLIVPVTEKLIVVARGSGCNRLAERRQAVVSVDIDQRIDGDRQQPPILQRLESQRAVKRCEARPPIGLPLARGSNTKRGKAHHKQR